MSKYPPLLAFIMALAVLSCKGPRKVTAEKCSLDYKNAKALLSHLRQNELKYDWLSARFSTDFQLDSNSYSFTVNMRARKDSVVWMSISPLLGIEVARVVLTRDSLFYIDKINSSYFRGDLNYISKVLQADLDFEMFQSLMVGNSAAFYDEDEKLRPGIDNCRYILGTVKKRKLRKVLEKNKELKDPLQTIWLLPNSYKISKIFFNDFSANRTFEVLYDDFQKVDTAQVVPQKAVYSIRAEKNIQISIDYSRITLDKPQNMPFVIPKSYTPVYFKEKE